jgi:hypothetical protein
MSFLAAAAEGALILPREAGEGDRTQRGGGGDPRRRALGRPLHHASHGPPPPSLSRRGRITRRLAQFLGSV